MIALHWDAKDNKILHPDLPKQTGIFPLLGTHPTLLYFCTSINNTNPLMQHLHLYVFAHATIS